MRRMILPFMMLLTMIAGDSGLIFAQSSPADVVETFLSAWNQQDYAAMYERIHPQSQQQYTLEEFVEQYATVAEKTALTTVAYTVNSTRMQGQSAEVGYDVTLESDTFGSIQDGERMMRLIQESGEWLVAWSTMDIFDTLLDADQLRVQSLPRQRAPIYDRNGQILAADGGVTVGMLSQKERMNSVEDCVALVGEVTLESALFLQARFNENNPDTLFFLGETTMERFEQHQDVLFDVCGVGQSGVDVYSSTPHRTYYGGSAMVHVAGYVGQVTAEEELRYGAGAMIGRSGVEEAYEDVLAGQPETVLRITEPGGTILRELAGTTGSEPIPVTLTIDRDIQMLTVQALSDAFNYAYPNWGGPGISSGGAAVVLDVNTGEILAMTSYPLFNPSLFSPDSVVSNRGDVLSEQVVNHYRAPLLNRAIQEQFAPGSVYKVVTLAAILNEGMTTSNEIYYCPLEWNGLEFGDTRDVRTDWRVMDDMDAAGDVTPAEALMASCNPFFWEYGAHLFNDVGAETVINYARQMGLGQSYGYDSGPLRMIEGVLPVPAGTDAAINEAVGQGNIALPPMQLAVMTMGIANSGTIYRPYLIQQVGGADGAPVLQTGEPEILNTLEFNPGVMEIIREGMCGVVNNEEFGTAWGRFYNWGTYSYAFITAEYQACGKTGTAEAEPYPNAWFVAYAPADDPEIAVVVMVDRSKEGSQIAAPIVRRILDNYFNKPEEVFPFWWGNEPFDPLPIPEGGGVG